jgi:hypothetical protein
MDAFPRSRGGGGNTAAGRQALILVKGSASLPGRCGGTTAIRIGRTKLRNNIIFHHIHLGFDQKKSLLLDVMT